MTKSTSQSPATVESLIELRDILTVEFDDLQIPGRLRTAQWTERANALEVAIQTLDERIEKLIL